MKRIEDKELLEKYRERRCDLCGWRGPNEVHHIKTRGSFGPDEEWNLVTLDRGCHTSIHLKGLKYFTDMYPHFRKLIEEKGWEICKVTNKWRKNETI